MQSVNKANGFKLSVITLAIMNVTAVVSLRGLASEAIYGLGATFRKGESCNRTALF